MTTNGKNFDYSWRKELLLHAKGNVLEISVGTGVNLKYYPSTVNLTATDNNAGMIEKAKLQANRNRVNAKFILSSIEDLKLKAKSFDTIVSTFSLGTHEDPIQLLNQFNKWCKPGGKILLMEHGLSKYRILRFLQLKWRASHYKKLGLNGDRDVKAILECSEPKIKRVERKLGGMIYLIWACPTLSY